MHLLLPNSNTLSFDNLWFHWMTRLNGDCFSARSTAFKPKHLRSGTLHKLSSLFKVIWLTDLMSSQRPRLSQGETHLIHQITAKSLIHRTSSSGLMSVSEDSGTDHLCS